MNSMLSSIHQQQGIDARGRRETLTGTVQNREFEVRAISTRRALCRKCRVREQKYEQKKKRRRKRGKKEKTKRREERRSGSAGGSDRLAVGCGNEGAARATDAFAVRIHTIQKNTIQNNTHENEHEERMGEKMRCKGLEMHAIRRSPSARQPQIDCSRNIRI